MNHEDPTHNAPNTTPKKPYVCDYIIIPNTKTLCGRDFALQSNLIRHKRLKGHFSSQEEEDRLRGFMCDYIDKETNQVCTAEYSDKRGLRQHQRNKGHDNSRSRTERKERCKFCDDRFLNKSALTQHIVKQHGANQLCCDICSFKRTMQRDLDYHYRRDHGVYPWKPHERLKEKSEEKFEWHCHLCEHNPFRVRGNLRRHYIDFHKVKPPPEFRRPEDESEEEPGEEPKDKPGKKRKRSGDEPEEEPEEEPGKKRTMG
ncbi:hypothetical protein F4808DRAFT_231482 [Astrocystis sublimbata]|nr:hypothetical protein F4808DRAFT_231482 [Astrocystis sublimbata]